MLVVVAVSFGLVFALLGLLFFAALKADTVAGALCAGLFGVSVAVMGTFDFAWVPTPGRVLAQVGVPDTTENNVAAVIIVFVVAAGAVWFMHRLGWVDSLSRRFGVADESKDDQA